MGKLNELMFKMLIHLDLKASFLKLLDIFLNLEKNLIRCINIMGIVVFNTVIGKIDNFFKNLLWFSWCDFGLDWGKDKLDFLIISIHDILLLDFGRLIMCDSLNLDSVFLIVHRTSECGLVSLLTTVTSHMKFY